MSSTDGLQRTAVFWSFVLHSAMVWVCEALPCWDQHLFILAGTQSEHCQSHDRFRWSAYAMHRKCQASPDQEEHVGAERQHPGLAGGKFVAQNMRASLKSSGAYV